MLFSLNILKFSKSSWGYAIKLVSLLAFLGKNEPNIKIFYKNYIFGNKNLFNGTFCHYFKTWSNVCFEV